MSNEELVKKITRQGAFTRFNPKDQRVLDAMLQVDRKDFLPLNTKSSAYYDYPVSIGHGQTCSQPSLVGFMAESLKLKPGMAVLEIGSGCGYSAAIASHLIGAQGYLVTVERLPELADLAEKNLEAHFGKDVEERLEVICGDGSIGCKKHAPFDRIYLTAGISEFFNPEILEEQLNKEDGILLYPSRRGPLTIITWKMENKEVQRLGGVAFVPLIGENA